MRFAEWIAYSDAKPKEGEFCAISGYNYGLQRNGRWYALGYYEQGTFMDREKRNKTYGTPTHYQVIGEAP